MVKVKGSHSDSMKIAHNSFNHPMVKVKVMNISTLHKHIQRFNHPMVKVKAKQNTRQQ